MRQSPYTRCPENYILLRDVRELGLGWLDTAVSIYRVFSKIHYVARRPCGRMGMVGHSSLHIQNVQRNTFCCETFVRADLRHHLPRDLIPTVCTLVKNEGF
jgi:hypothetical protein